MNEIKIHSFKNCSNKILAIIPCFNEQKYIFDVVTISKEYVDVVLVVDDGSSDNTAALAESAGAMVVRHSLNQGKGAALTTAFNIIKDLDFKAIVVLDGDGQHDPIEIDNLLKPVLNENADMVIGSRFLEDSAKIPFYRKIGQSVLNVATNLGSGVKVSDSQSGFRAFNSKAIKFMTFNETGLSVESEMQFIAAKHKIKICEVSISTIYNSTLKRSPIKHGLSVLCKVLGMILVHKLRKDAIRTHG